MKSVAISGTRGNVPGISFMDSQRAMQAVGNNSGNLVFQYAVSKMITEPTKVVGLDIQWSPEKIQETCRILVIPSANFLREGLDFSHYVNFLERSNLPLVFVGLGAQADNFESMELDFHPSVLRLLDLIKERSASTSIRGEFTARVLEKHGIYDFEITGCPSNFINTADDFEQSLFHKLQNAPESFMTQADEPWPKSTRKRDVERRLAEWSLNGRSVMVQQSVPRMIEYLRRKNSSTAPIENDDFEKSLKKAIMPGADIDEFGDFLATKVRTYFSVDQWLEDSSHFDFSIGLRLHGNMVAWQSGTPALWITHDSRTQELVDCMQLPSIQIDEFLEKCGTVSEAWERTEYDPSAYTRRRRELASKMNSVFNANSIKTNLS